MGNTSDHFYRGQRSKVSYLPYEQRFRLFLDLKNGMELVTAAEKYGQGLKPQNLCRWRKSKEFRRFEEITVQNMKNGDGAEEK